MSPMKLLFVSALASTTLMLSSVGAAAQVISEAPQGIYKEDSHHAYITFSYNHKGYSTPHLIFRSHETTLKLDPKNPINSQVKVVIDATSIDSGVDVFNGHLNGAKHFDTAKYPEITFTSTSLTQSSPTTGTMTGDVTMKGQTHPIEMDVTFNNMGKSREGVETLGFSANGELKRSKWGLDMAIPFVSDEVDFNVEIELLKSE